MFALVFEVDRDFVELIDVTLEIVDFDLIQINPQLKTNQTSLIKQYPFLLPPPGCRRPVELSEPLGVCPDSPP
jgi:hypothetical protein